MKTVLNKGEKIVLETKPHLVTLLFPVLLILFGVIIELVFEAKNILLALIIIAYFIYCVIYKKNKLWTVTNIRVIEEYGVFSNNSKESPLEKINNITYSQSFLGKKFGYGNVEIQTAAEVGSTKYISVEYPKELKDSITDMQGLYKEQQIKKHATELAKAISKGQQNKTTDISIELEKLHDLLHKGILTQDEFNNLKTKILNL